MSRLTTVRVQLSDNRVTRDDILSITEQNIDLRDGVADLCNMGDREFGREFGTSN